MKDARKYLPGISLVVQIQPNATLLQKKKRTQRKLYISALNAKGPSFEGIGSHTGKDTGNLCIGKEIQIWLICILSFLIMSMPRKLSSKLQQQNYHHIHKNHRKNNQELHLRHIVKTHHKYRNR